MEQAVAEPEKSKPSRLWQIVRWIPLTLMLLSSAMLLVMLGMDGMSRVIAWNFLELIPLFWD